jgi:hypothetical protein
LGAADSCPVAIEVFDGATADPKTLTTQIDKLKKRFVLKHAGRRPRHENASWRGSNWPNV